MANSDAIFRAATRQCKIHFTGGYATGLKSCSDPDSLTRQRFLLHHYSRVRKSVT
jgi:hypothetical protein